MTQEQKEAVRYFAGRLMEVADNYGWPGSVTVMKNVLAEVLDNVQIPDTVEDEREYPKPPC